MRVEAYNSVAQIYKTNRAAGASAAAKTEKSTYDVSNEAFAEKLLEKYRSFML